MKLGRLNHIGVATPSIADSIVFYRDVMGATTIHEPFDLPEQGVKVCFVDTPGAGGAMDGTQIELIEPLPGNMSIAGFLEKNPAGGAASCLLRGARYSCGQGGVRGAGQTGVGGAADRGAWDADFLPASQGYGRGSDRDYGDAEGGALTCFASSP